MCKTNVTTLPETNILLMEEILHHLKDVKDRVNNGMNYQPQLVQDFWIINDITWKMVVGD